MQGLQICRLTLVLLQENVMANNIVYSLVMLVNLYFTIRWHGASTAYQAYYEIRVVWGGKESSALGRAKAWGVGKDEQGGARVVAVGS